MNATTIRTVLLLLGLTLASGCLETLVPTQSASDGGGSAAQTEPALFNTLTGGSYRGSSSVASSCARRGTPAAS